MHLGNLKCCANKNPIQVDEQQPFFSWQIFADEELSVVQTAYRIVVISEDGAIKWDSQKKDTAEMLHVVYEGEPLEPDLHYKWKLDVWTNLNDTPLTKESWFETGLMKNWCGKWIGYDALLPGMEPFDPCKPFYCADDFKKGKNEYYLPPAPYLRKEFFVKNSLKKAKLYVSAQGIVDVKLNEKAVTEEKFLPGTANYNCIAWSKAFDVTELLQEKENAIGVILADGWYSGYVGLQNRQWYGNHPRMMLELVLTYTDGSKEHIVSDETWKAHYGAVREADIFQGESYDATEEIPNYSAPGFADGNWENVAVGSEHEVVPEAHPGVPIVERECFDAETVTDIDEDTVLVDLGKLISGVLQLTVKAEKGAHLEICHSEILKPGTEELYLDGNRSARAKDIFVCRGDGIEVLKPRFTYHGFRYAKIKGLKKARLLNVKGVSIGSKFSDETEFETSDAAVNLVFRTCKESMLCNLMDNPTDVCARDERLGWGMEGDHALSSVAMLGDMECFIRKWVRDIWSAQHEDGSLEPIAPPLMMKDIEPYSGDLQTNHGVRMIYTLYKLYGDTEIVKEYYPKMERFFEFLDCNADRGIRFGTAGDWLNIWETTDHSDVNHGYGDGSPGIVGTAHYAKLILKMIEMSEGIGMQEQARKYGHLYEKVKRAFVQNFVQRDGTIRFGKQGDYVLALSAGLIPEEYEQNAAGKFVKMLTEKGRVFWRGGTASTPYFLDVLKKYGYYKEAVQFLASREFPGIGYMALRSPGTVWERWDGIWEDGTLHPQPMNAMCHIGLTVVDEYLVTGLAGITPLKPGFEFFELSPAPSDEIKEVNASYKSKSGTIKVHWKNETDRFEISFEVPANTQARVVLPCKEGTKPKACEGSLLDMDTQNNRCVFYVKSGHYRVETKK